MIDSRLAVMNRLGRAMADSTRSRILLRLLARPAYPSAIAEELGLTKSNVSNHLGCLRDCGIVTTVNEGRRTRYEIAGGGLSEALEALLQLRLDADEDAPCLDPECSCCDSRGVQA